MIEKVFIGCGAGFSGDRFDASIPIVNEFKKINAPKYLMSVSYTHLRAHETSTYLVCRLLLEKIFLMIRRPPRSTPTPSSAASDVYKRQVQP